MEMSESVKRDCSGSLSKRIAMEEFHNLDDISFNDGANPNRGEDASFNSFCDSALDADARLIPPRTNQFGMPGMEDIERTPIILAREDAQSMNLTEANVNLIATIAKFETPLDDADRHVDNLQPDPDPPYDLHEYDLTELALFLREDLLTDDVKDFSLDISGEVSGVTDVEVSESKDNGQVSTLNKTPNVFSSFDNYWISFTIPLMEEMHVAIMSYITALHSAPLHEVLNIKNLKLTRPVDHIMLYTLSLKANGEIFANLRCARVRGEAYSGISEKVEQNELLRAHYFRFVILRGLAPQNDTSYGNKEISVGQVESGDADSGKSYERIGGYGGPRGFFRGGFNNGDGEGDRPHRPLDCRSRIGCDYESKREGADCGSWGTQTDEYDHVADYLDFYPLLYLGAANLNVFREAECVKHEAKTIFLLECFQATTPLNEVV